MPDNPSTSLVSESITQLAHTLPSRILRVFAAGLLTLLPLTVTIVITAVAFSFAYDWVGPSSQFGKMLVALGLGVSESLAIGYLIGLGLVAMLVFAVGLLAELGLKKWLRSKSEMIAGRIPVIGTIYETVGNFITMLSKSEQGNLKGMSPVWCRFGPSPSAVVLGLVTSSETVVIGKTRFRPVIIPTSPVPIGGGLIFLPEEWVSPAAGIGVDGLTSIYVSMGATVPQFVKSGDQTCHLSLDKPTQKE